jgi:nicotinamidase-related amidase
MKLSRAALFASGVAFAVFSAQVSEAQTAGGPMQTLAMPARPDPARVTLDPKTTALMLLDFVEPICSPQPTCKDGMVPAIIPFIDRARAAGLTVAYGTREENTTRWLKEVAPAMGDIRIVSTAQDRFYNTDLDKTLKARGIKTLIIAGWKVSGSVTYTSVGAMARDYTVVIPVDATSAATGYETAIGFYNVLNSGTSNLQNQPLKPRAATLSRTDLIEFQ